MAVAVALFPLWSIAVMVTVTSPTLLQSNESMSSDTEETLQLSVAEATSYGEMVAEPDASNSTVMSIVEIEGSMLSTTSTVAEEEWVLPAMSVTVRVTVLSPKSEQSKAV